MGSTPLAITVMTRGGIHPGPGRTRGAALAIILGPKREIINFEQHHKIIISLYHDMHVYKYDCIFINMKLFMQLVSILDFSIPFMFSQKAICIVIYN